MTTSTQNTAYTSAAKILHWLVAALVVLQFVLANLAENADDAGQALRELALLAHHKSVGISILALAVVRLLWRLAMPPPELPPTIPRWQKSVSRISHVLLYGLIFLLPISGWLMSSASAYSVSWFNLVQLPDFVAPDPELKAIFLGIHKVLGKALFAVATLHMLAALKHHFIDKDSVLTRMSSPLSLGLFALVIAIGAATLGKKEAAIDEVAPVADLIAEAIVEPVVEPVEQLTDLPIWQIDAASSYIRFTGDQAGASFDGAWQDWSAELRFDSERLEDSSFDVSIRTAAVSTGDADRDATLADPEWFDVVRFPEARYRANRFTPLADGDFTAHGELIVKGVASPVSLNFSVKETGAERLLVGTAGLLRLDLGVGTGEWQDTTWVGNDVQVSVRVQASASDR